jgi:hypothetical protein
MRGAIEAVPCRPWAELSVWMRKEPMRKTWCVIKAA